jgi:TorA maturation chaperone TorD
MPSALLASASVPAAEPEADAGRAAAELADLFVLLAAAFAPPPAALATRDWCRPLAADLEDLGLALGLDTSAATRSLRETADGPFATEPWLVEYSRLFLVPPVPVTLNTGIYLEGGLAGVSAQMMAQCYATAGFAQKETFRDLPDHVSMQVEFVGALLGRHADGGADALAMACEFTEGFVVHWIEPLHGACAKASASQPAAGVYAALAGVLRAAVDRIG